MSDLKACPFCAGPIRIEAVIISEKLLDRYGKCDSCGCLLPMDRHRNTPTREQVAELINTRPREAELEKEVTRLTQAAERMREMAVEVCQSERLPAECASDWDIGYNAAVADCIEAIRALKVGEG